MTEITITIPATEAMQRHVESLQATITKRNAENARLAERLEEALTGEPNQKALAAEFKRGFISATNQMMTATNVAARALSEVRKDAFEIYLQSQKRDS